MKRCPIGLFKSGRLGLFASLACGLVPLTYANSGPPEAPSLPPPELPAEIKNARPTTPPPPPPDLSELHAQLALLEEFLNLPPEELQRVRHTITLIERLSVEEREAMKQRLAQMRAEIRSADSQIGPFLGVLSESRRPAFRRMWLSLPQAERNRLVESFAHTPKDNQPAWLDERLDAFLSEEKEALRRLSSPPSGPS